MSLTKKDKEIIKKLSKTKTIRELARVYLNYLTIEEMARFISTYLVLRERGEEDETLDYFIKDQFGPILKSLILGLSDLIPDLIVDNDFRKLISKLRKQ